MGHHLSLECCTGTAYTDVHTVQTESAVDGMSICSRESTEKKGGVEKGVRSQQEQALWDYGYQGAIKNRKLEGRSPQGSHELRRPLLSQSSATSKKVESPMRNYLSPMPASTSKASPEGDSQVVADSSLPSSSLLVRSGQDLFDVPEEKLKWKLPVLEQEYVLLTLHVVGFSLFLAIFATLCSPDYDELGITVAALLCMHLPLCALTVRTVQRLKGEIMLNQKKITSFPSGESSREQSPARETRHPRSVSFDCTDSSKGSRARCTSLEPAVENQKFEKYFPAFVEEEMLAECDACLKVNLLWHHSSVYMTTKHICLLPKRLGAGARNSKRSLSPFSVDWTTVKQLNDPPGGDTVDANQVQLLLEQPLRVGAYKLECVRLKLWNASDVFNIRHAFLVSTQQLDQYLPKDDDPDAEEIDNDSGSEEVCGENGVLEEGGVENIPASIVRADMLTEIYEAALEGVTVSALFKEFGSEWGPGSLLEEVNADFCTSWKKTPWRCVGGDTHLCEATLDVRLPSLPLCPKSTVALLEYLLRCDSNGVNSPTFMVFESSSLTPDVPYGKCFHVQEKLIFEATPLGDSVHFRKLSGAVFSDSCWLQRTIESNVVRENTKATHAFVEKLCKKLRKDKTIQIGARTRSISVESFAEDAKLGRRTSVYCDSVVQAWELERLDTASGKWCAPFVSTDGSRRWRWVDAHGRRHPYIREELSLAEAQGCLEPPFNLDFYMEGKLGDWEAGEWEYGNDWSTREWRIQFEPGHLVRKRNWLIVPENGLDIQL